MKIRILVVSDLHVMEKESESSRLSMERLELPVVQHPIEALKEFLSKYVEDIDYMINLGDVTNKSNRLCWNYGIRMFRDVQNFKKIPTLIHITGNHDVTCVGDIPDHDYFYLPRHTKAYPIDSEERKNEYWSKGYCIIPEEHVLFFVLNSETHLQSAEDLNKPPLLREDLVASIDEELAQYDTFEGVKIALMHHHIVMHSDPTGNLTANDVIEKGDLLLTCLKKHSFSLVMHGHKHLARIKQEDDIVVFAAGSLSSTANVLVSNSDNCFHIVEIDIEGHEVNGFIKTFRYDLRDGWVPVTDPNARFPHHAGFGIKKSMQVLSEEIMAKYQQRLDAGEQIKEGEYLNEFKEISYLSASQWQELKQILSTQNYDFYESRHLLLKLLI